MKMKRWCCYASWSQLLNHSVFLGVFKGTVIPLPPALIRGRGKYARGRQSLPLGRLLVSSHLLVFTVAGLCEAADSHHSRNAGWGKLINTPREQADGDGKAEATSSYTRVIQEPVPIYLSQWSRWRRKIKSGLVFLAKGAGVMGTSVGSRTVKGQRGFPIPTPPSRLGRYSAVRHLLADLEQETRAALKTLYGFSETTSRKRREAQSWSSVRKGTDPKFLNLAPLMAFEKGDTGKARDFFTGRKRKVNARIIHKASDVMHIHNSKEVVGFQLVRRTSSTVRGLGWDHGSG